MDTIIIIIIFLILLWVQYKKTAFLKKEMTQLTSTHELYASESTAKYKELLSQKKSSEVRLGQITEHLVPFLNAFPYNPKKAQFLGNPIDFVVFEKNEVAFVEIKTGKSQLNKNQREIKRLIEEDKVTFKIIRIK